MDSLFIAYENDEWCRFVVHIAIGSPSFISFYCVLNGIKVRVFFEKNNEKMHLCHHDKNYCYFCKSDIPVLKLIAGSRNMSKLSKNVNL